MRIAGNHPSLTTSYTLDLFKIQLFFYNFYRFIRDKFNNPSGRDIYRKYIELSDYLG
ncbi:MAG: hypothetical protein Kow0090_13040 [Myxococcota bacterium]